MIEEAQSRFTTVRDLVRYAVSRFNSAALTFGHGSVDAYDEAVYLVLHALHLPIDRLDPFLDARLLVDEVNTVLSVIEQRAESRLPAAYLTREAWLGDYRFYVDQRTIVPRSFIAELLRDGLSPWIDDAGEVRDVLELCTGSGCLAVLAADAFPNATVDAVDISADALEVARRNVAAYDLQERIRLIEGDLFAPLDARRYDLILANPPYVPDASMARLPHEHRHEPLIALAGGVDGLDVVRRILEQARDRLQPDGVLVVEVGHERAALEAAFPQLPFAWLTTSAGDDMVFLLRRNQWA